MAEDDDIEQDSEAYRKWRSGDDNDKYASSKTPTETGSKSGSYTIPKDDDDEYALPGEDDGGSGKSWLDGDLNWPLIIVVFVVFALIASSIFAFMLSSSEPDTKPSEWPTTEGVIVDHIKSNTFNGTEYCDDKGDDEPVYDDECYKDFIFELDVDIEYSIENKSYIIKEVVEKVDSYTIMELDPDGDGIYEKQDEYFKKFKEYWNEQAANGTLAINTTVTVTYNPEEHEDGYAFANPPDDPLGFIGWFVVCCGGMLCIPIVIGGVIMSWAKRATGMGRHNRGWGPFGGYNRDRGGFFGGNYRMGGGRRSGGGGRRRGSSRSGGRRTSGGRRR